MKLRLAILTSLLMLLGTVDAFAGIYGAAVSSMSGGHPSIGLGYSALQRDVKNSPNTRIEQNLVYMQLGLGLGGGWELYVRGGGSDMSIKPIAGPYDGMSDELLPYAGAGFRGRFYDGRVLDIALFGQGNFYTFEDFIDEDTDSGFTYTLTDYWDASAGVAFQVEIDKAYLYFGPFYYTWAATLGIDGVEVDLEPVHRVGTMVGIRWPLVSGWDLDVEAQIADKYVVGAALNYPF